MAVAALPLGALLQPSPGRAAEATGAVAATPSEAPGGINAFLGDVSVWAVTDSEGAPALEAEAAGRLGHLYLDEQEARGALKKLRGGEGSGLEVRELRLADVYGPLVAAADEKQLGGRFQVEPASADVQAALLRLKVGSLGGAGVVPLFVCPSLEIERESEVRVPAFLHEKDLKEAVAGAGAGVDADDIVVTTLQGVVSELQASGSGSAGSAAAAARRLVAIADARDVGLGKWR